ncbi:FecR family protein [Parapedobacter indicus]|uniref:FecR family protein n=1 Tax=Parapedobacter indicus TaxID=1477437 RepID=A0A1I3PRQ2_9SPHI|nr:FecR family protein [Parapedobacter indicus]PPL00551.1 FecR family protein [Parapedobacter indicus]SFJ24288.1 FecR family protein [Parapedobacter indicus]
MPKQRHYIAYLIAQSLRQALSSEEQAALNAWLDERPENRAFFDTLEDTENLRQKLQVFHEVDRKRLWEITQAKMADRGMVKDPSIRKLRFLLPYAAAVILIALIGTWVYSLVGDQQTMESDRASLLSHADIPPGGSRATLTLADGQTIDLSEAQTGIIVGDGITYLDGNSVLGDQVNEGTREHSLMLTTPKGGTYQVTLPDGTKVWLNAASTLKYPSRFAGNERVVELNGEAYFDVTPVRKAANSQIRKSANSQRIPFKVVSNGQTVEVLGTQFNIEAYGGDSEIKTTLVKGAVRIVPETASQPAVTLSPGQQSRLAGESIVVNDVDIEPYVAWKLNMFHFKHTPFAEMMHQIERWYDVDVVYNSQIPQETFSGRMKRNVSLLGVLKLLKASEIKFRIEGRQLIID